MTAHCVLIPADMQLPTELSAMYPSPISVIIIQGLLIGFPKTMHPLLPQMGVFSVRVKGFTGIPILQACDNPGFDRFANRIVSNKCHFLLTIKCVYVNRYHRTITINWNYPFNILFRNYLLANGRWRIMCWHRSLSSYGQSWLQCGLSCYSSWRPRCRWLDFRRVYILKSPKRLLS